MSRRRSAFERERPSPLLAGRVRRRCREVEPRIAQRLLLTLSRLCTSRTTDTTLLDLVNVYDRRFSIALTPQEKRDLVAFLEAL